jgi:hypothetical protein
MLSLLVKKPSGFKAAVPVAVSGMYISSASNIIRVVLIGSEYSIFSLQDDPLVFPHSLM